LDPNGTSFVDRHYTKAYLRHLMVSKEMLGAQIASIHNLAFYLQLVADIRSHIEKGDFKEWKDSIIERIQTRL
jgi:queuine tRNA-ribosyltransferase